MSQTSQAPSDIPSADSAKTPARSHRRWHDWEAFFERLWILFCLYVLSIGPCFWWWSTARLVGGSPLIVAFYQPLVELGERIPPFRDWLNWYVRLWIF